MIPDQGHTYLFDQEELWDRAELLRFGDELRDPLLFPPISDVLDEPAGAAIRGVESIVLSPVSAEVNWETARPRVAPPPHWSVAR